MFMAFELEMNDKYVLCLVQMAALAPRGQRSKAGRPGRPQTDTMKYLLSCG